MRPRHSCGMGFCGQWVGEGGVQHRAVRERTVLVYSFAVSYCRTRRSLAALVFACGVLVRGMVG
jgi:hypothetical protein